MDRDTPRVEARDRARRLAAGIDAVHGEQVVAAAEWIGGAARRD
jgi:hypothetical protein